MHARVSTFQSPPEHVTDAAVDNMKANLVPRILEMAGNRGAIFLIDRDTGRTMPITLWDSEEALGASEAKASQVCEDAAQTTSASIGDIQRFEAPVVELHRVRSPPSPGRPPRARPPAHSCRRNR